MAIKTLHLTNYYHPASGGIRTFYHALLDGANQLRRPMRLVVPGDADGVEEVGEFGRIYSLKAPRTPVFDRRYRLILPHSFLFPWARRLRHILQREQPEVVEVCDKYSLCWLAGVLRREWIPGVPRPTLVGLTCERMDDNVGVYLSAAPAARRLTALYMGRIYARLFDFHVAVSRYVSEELADACPAVRKRLRVLPMGVHLDHLGPQHRDTAWRTRLQQESGGTAATALLLYVGRLAPEKNLALLISMMAWLAKGDAPGHPGRDCRLLLAGSGPLEGWLREQSARSRGRLCLLGQVNGRVEMARLLANVDAVVHPNPREPFGIGPLEAMASGTPLVAPNSGGVLEYTDESCAWLTKPEGGAFAGAVREILSNPELAQAKSEQARRVAEEYDWRNITPQFFATYDLLHAHRQGQRHLVSRRGLFEQPAP